MAVNKHFHTSGVAAVTTEQNLYRDLVSEAIQIYGHDVFYINRTLVAEDTVLGEDSLSVFRDATKIEMYMENADGGFAGEREIMNQFGLQNLSEATFVVSKERFQGKTKQITIESGTDSTEGGSILLESGSISSSIDLEGEDFYILNETDAADTYRQYEGDALYHPKLKKMFQINFVDHDEPFFQLDNNPVYKLRCRLFDYSSEALDTGIDTIDAIEDALSISSSDFQFTLEQNTATVDAMILESDDGRIIHQTESSGQATDELVALETSDMTTSAGSLLSETGDYLVQESYIIGDADTDKTAQNELFDTLDDTVLDFSESNPFGDVGST